MKLKELSATELVALSGGLILGVALFLPWYELANRRAQIDGITGPDLGPFSAWDAHPIIRILLLLAAIAPLILSYILIRNHKLSWPRGELTAVIAMSALGLLFYTLIVDKPGEPNSLVSVKYGAWLAVGGAALMLAGSALRASSTERPRKPPGVLEISLPDRNVALELVRVTEAAALGAQRWVGRGDKEAADQAAVDMMRAVLDTVGMDGVVVIGEGEKDEAPMLFNGEQVGDGSGPPVDIAVDPLEGTTLTAKGMPNALSVIALAERGSMFDPGPCVYMEKLAGATEIADLLDLDTSIPDLVGAIAERKGGEVGDVTVVVLDRPRHQEGIKTIREAGARVRLISDGDVAAALLAVSDRTRVDLLWGIGGTPEGVISAAAIKCIGGEIVGRLYPRDEGERQAALDAGYDLDRQLRASDLVNTEDCFFSATGVTDGDMLEGVRILSSGAATTESLVMRARSGTVRRVSATHDRSKLRSLNAALT